MSSIRHIGSKVGHGISTVSHKVGDVQGKVFKFLNKVPFVSKLMNTKIAGTASLNDIGEMDKGRLKLIDAVGEAMQGHGKQALKTLQSGGGGLGKMGNLAKTYRG